MVFVAGLISDVVYRTERSMSPRRKSWAHEYKDLFQAGPPFNRRHTCIAYTMPVALFLLTLARGAFHFAT